MSEIWMDVDAALSEVPVNIIALTDDTDFKSREESVTYDQSGLDLLWNFVTTAGAFSQTAVTPTDTAGDYDWVNQGNGYYTIEIPADSGASINNDAEGFGFFSGFATGILPWRGPLIGFRAAAINNLMIDVPTALTNLLAMYDGTGYIDDTAPSSRAQVASIGTISGGGQPFEIIADNTGGAIKTITFVGSQTGTFANTEAEDGVYHVIDDDGDAIDIVYRANVGGSRIATEIIFEGYLSSGNDALNIQAYDFVGTAWETRRVLDGQGGSNNIPLAIPLLSKHTGIGADLGDVLIRFVGSSLSNPQLNVDLLLIEAVGATSTIGFEGGAVWVDTNNGTSGVGEGVGFLTRPSDNITDSLAIAAANNLVIIHSLPGSAHELVASVDGIEFKGFSYSVALSDESVSGALFEGATITGDDDGSNAIATVYRNCTMGSNTLGLHILESPTLTGDMVLAEAGSYLWKNPKSFIAGGGAPSVDFQSAAETKALNVRGIFGGLEIKNYNAGGGTHTMTLGGTGQRIFNASCAGGTLEQRGQFKETDNASGAVTVVRDKPSQDVIDILADTGTDGVIIAPTGLDLIVSTATGMVAIAKAVWDRIISKDNHNIGQSAGKILRQSGDWIQVDGSVSDVSPTVGGFNTDLTQPDDFWEDALLTFSNGAANAGLGKPVSTFLNANGALTFLAPDDWPVTPVNGDEFVMVANHVHPVAQIADAVADEALSGHTTDGTLGKTISDIKADTVLPEKNQPFANIPVLMVDDTDHVTPKTGLNVTVQRSLDGGSYGNATGSIAEVSNGTYQFDASAADMNADSIMFKFSGTDADDAFLTVFTR